MQICYTETIELKRSDILNGVASAIGGAVIALLSIYIHRFLINWYVPIGFILALILLLFSGIVIRAYYNKVCIYILSLICSITMYFLATVSNGSILMLASGIEGEKPWSGYIGWIILIGSFLIPFSATLLPKKWFARVLSRPLWRTGDNDIDFMLSLVNITDVQMEKAFASGKITVDNKPDGTPVTEFDRNIEQFIRTQIKKHFPNDAILGEEFGFDKEVPNDVVTDSSSHTPNKSVRRWIIDPIDGTKNFVRGVPIFATLIALEETIDGITKPTKSVVSAPLLKRRWWGDGSSAYAQFDNYKPQKITVSGTKSISEATLSISSRGGWIQSTALKWFDILCGKVARVRGFGDFYSYMLLSEGAVDIATEPELELYDIAALIPIVEGAGGVFTDIKGKSWQNTDGIKSSFAHNGNFAGSIDK